MVADTIDRVVSCYLGIMYHATIKDLFRESPICTTLILCSSFVGNIGSYGTGKLHFSMRPADHANSDEYRSQFTLRSCSWPILYTCVHPPKIHYLLYLGCMGYTTSRGCHG